jgi:hypothetical protein
MHHRSAQETSTKPRRGRRTALLGLIPLRQQTWRRLEARGVSFRSSARCLPSLSEMSRKKAPVFSLCRCVAAASIAGALLLSLERNARASRVRTDRPSPRRSTTAPSSQRTSEGRVVEVRRSSRELTVRTSRGATERVVIPPQAAIRAPHGSSTLSGIRAGMALHVEGQADEQGRIVARGLVAH